MKSVEQDPLKQAQESNGQLTRLVAELRTQNEKQRGLNDLMQEAALRRRGPKPAKLFSVRTLDDESLMDVFDDIECVGYVLVGSGSGEARLLFNEFWDGHQALDRYDFLTDVIGCARELLEDMDKHSEALAAFGRALHV